MDPTDHGGWEYEDDADTADLAGGGADPGFGVDPHDPAFEVDGDPAWDGAAQTDPQESAEGTGPDPTADPHDAGTDPAPDGPGPHDIGPDVTADPDGAAPAAGLHTAEGPVGTDPDADLLAGDPAWDDPGFPAALDLAAVPEPVDGLPWSDAASLGDTPPPDPDDGYDGAPPAAQLWEYAAGRVPDVGDPWAVLLADPDPATASLARWWAPGG